jgi:hypothetical protein
LPQYGFHVTAERLFTPDEWHVVKAVDLSVTQSPGRNHGTVVLAKDHIMIYMVAATKINAKGAEGLIAKCTVHCAAQHNTPSHGLCTVTAAPLQYSWCNKVTVL